MNNHTDTNDLDRFKIKYKFIPMMKGSSVDISLLADIEYIDARFEELKLCYQQIAKKIGQINIVSKTGAYEFDIANSLVSYYRLSAVRLNSARDNLLRKDIPLTEDEIKQREEAAVKWENYMSEAFREKRL